MNISENKRIAGITVLFAIAFGGLMYYGFDCAGQADEFRDVFYTMRDEDVAGWVRSLQLRGIALPDELKEEVFLIVGERRERKTV